MSGVHVLGVDREVGDKLQECTGKWVVHILQKGRSKL